MLLLCLAVSLDGKIATNDEGQPDFTSREDRRRLFRLRAESDLVLVGANTVRQEELPPLVRDPELREQRRGRSAHPAVAIVSASQDLPWASPYFTERQQEMFLITRAPTAATQRACAELEVEILETAEDGALAPVVATLVERGYERILGEGGGGLVNTLLREELVDELHLTIAPTVMGGVDTPSLTRGPVLDPFPRFELREMRRVGSELHLVYVPSDAA